MLRTVLVLAGIAGALTLAGADDFVIIRVTVPETAGLDRVPMVVATDAEGLRKAVGFADLPEGVLYAREVPSQRPVEIQLDLTPDGRAQFSGLLPPAPAGPREIRVWLRNAPAAPPTPPQTLTAARVGDAVRVRGSGYEILHDPMVNGGLLSQITVLATDRVFSPQMNDRVYRKGMGGYYLRKDPGAEVTLVCEGPYMTEVRVSARYMGDQEAVPESNPHATYTFRYWAGLPIISVTGRMEQEAEFSWNELHFLEIHFEDDSFSRFAIGDAEAVQEFTDEQRTFRGSGWGALIGDGDVLGLTGSVIVYDGLGGYGRYLHGPWIQWSAAEESFQRWLYVDSGEGALQRLDTIASHQVEARDGALLTQGLAASLSRLRAQARQSSDATQRARIMWRVALIEMAAMAGAPLGQVCTAAEELQGALEAGAWRQFTPDLPGGRLLLADDGQLGVGIRMTETGLELVSLYDMQTQREMLAATSELFALQLSDAAGSTVTLGSSEGWQRWNARTAGGDGSAQIIMTLEGPLHDGLAAMRAELTCAIRDGASRWRISVANDTTWSIDQVIMPVLRGVRIGADSNDDTLYVPHGYGRAFPGGTGARYQGYYPSGSCALPLLIVTDERGGLYFAAHDTGAATKNMVTDSASLGVPLSCEVPAPDASVAGNDFETPGEMVMARVEGGWYPATQRYRAWLQENAPWWPEGDPDYDRPDRPAWLNDIAAWVLYGGGPESVVGPTKAFAEFMDLPVAIHWYNWHQIPFDNDYPHYFPTKEGFAEGVAELQAAGVRIVPYINGRLWDTDTESFQETAYRYCTRDRNGEPYIEVYGSGEKLAPMCIATQFWRDTLHDIVMRLMSEVGVDGVYMDQIAAARPRLCYDPSHGHPLAGGNWWAAGYWKLLERIQRDIAAVSPEKMLTTESNAESYARWFDTYLMCNSLGDRLTPLFPAVYGSKILGFGRYMSREDWDAPESLAQKQGQLFVWGTQLWWSQPQVIEHEFAGPWLRDLARLRYRVREFFNAGRMLAPPVFEGNDTKVHADWHRRGLEATTPAVLASMWALADGRVLVPMVNCSEQPQQVTLVFDMAQYGWAEDARFMVSRLGPETTQEIGSWQGASRQVIELAGLEMAALVLTPAEQG